MDNSILRNCGITAMSIDITYNCNFRCRHCFNRSGEHCFGERELTDEELMKIIVEVADIAPRSLCIQNGKVLYRKDKRKNKFKHGDKWLPYNRRSCR